MTLKVWLAQLWAENLLGVLARSRTLYEEIAWLAERGDLERVFAVLPLCYQQPVKNHVDAYLRAWGYLRPFATADDAARFFRLLQERAPELDRHLYGLVLRHGLWYLYNSRLFLANPCPDRLWTVRDEMMSQIVLARAGPAVRPWPLVARDLAAAEPASLAARAESELVVLRVGEELFWNPKLEGLEGSAELLDRLAALGLRPRTGFHRLVAEG